MTLEDLEALEKAATPGPWRWQWAHPGYLLGSYATTDVDRMITCVLDGVVDCDEDGRVIDENVAAKEPDRDFIAAARTYLPKLLAVARAAKGFIHWYTQEDCDTPGVEDKIFEYEELMEKELSALEAST